MKVKSTELENIKADVVINKEKTRFTMMPWAQIMPTEATNSYFEIIEFSFDKTNVWKIL